MGKKGKPEKNKPGGNKLRRGKPQVNIPEKEEPARPGTETAQPGESSLLEYWAYNRRKWYLLYFYVGIGVNFLLYYTKPYGFDPSGSILWGSLFGLGIPLAIMAIGVWIHKKMIGL